MIQDEQGIEATYRPVRQRPHPRSRGRSQRELAAVKAAGGDEQALAHREAGAFDVALL